MAFHFSLNGVLRLREGLEQAALQQLRITAAAVALTLTEIESLEKNMIDARRDALDATVITGMTGAELHFEISRQAALIALRSQLMEKFAELEKKRRQQQILYLQARMKREIISNLYKRQIAAYKLEQMRQEQRWIDELFLVRGNSNAE